MSQESVELVRRVTNGLHGRCPRGGLASRSQGVEGRRCGFRAPVARSDARADDDQIFLLEASAVPGTEVPLVAEAIERVIQLCFPSVPARVVARGNRGPVLRLEVLPVVPGMLEGGDFQDVTLERAEVDAVSKQLPDVL